MKIIILFFVFTLSLSSQSFLKQQKRYSRFRNAHQIHLSNLQSSLQKHSISLNSVQIFLRAFKESGKLELWVKSKKETTFQLFKTYDFCESSGVLGPKRMRGDEQIPEGVYFIDRFNPASSFHLSLGINYPNKSDRVLGKKGKLGGDIFIHGDCVTIGCIPITDEKIKELYVLAVYAKHNGQQKIPVHIFPNHFSKGFYSNHKELKSLHNFWKSLEPIYSYFETNKVLPKTIIQKNGNYRIND